MIIVDGHCDVLTKIMEKNEELYQNTGHLDLSRLQKYEGWVQFFAAFIEPSYGQAYALRRSLEIIDRFYIELEKNNDRMALCLDYKDIQGAITNKKIAAMLSIEGGDALQGQIASLRMLYKLGVRSICLTWNHRNEIADGVAEQQSGSGLTPFGRNVVAEMNKLGMIVDTSHLAEKGFWDVIEISRNPIVASHSNAKSICSHRRNLTDEQIIALAKNNGLMGINLYPYFLTMEKEAKISHVVSHIEHIAALVGCDNIGLGADYDGIECTPVDLIGVEDIYKIAEELGRLNYSTIDVENIMGKNFLRVIKQVCG